ncbi:13847_t:CDS:2 [Ambispora leptoticha]|uniref:13847_t:CDS:1 n=1 Tax=Ambispora leptoticha TaxID=144679 RepID=A0A9N8V8M3_9GLOM|nr:13847_t:CDS:2 [Ambispora leptoticha]
MSNENLNNKTYQLKYKSVVTDKKLLVVLYQAYPSIPGTDNDALEPVAWIINEVTYKQPVRVEYQENYDVAIVNYFDEDEIGVIKSFKFCQQNWDVRARVEREDFREIKGLPVNSKVDFEVSPQYYLGIFEGIKAGQFLLRN